MKYLLSAPDDDMLRWRRHAASKDLKFARWLRAAAEEKFYRENEPEQIEAPGLTNGED